MVMREGVYFLNLESLDAYEKVEWVKLTLNMRMLLYVRPPDGFTLW